MRKSIYEQLLEDLTILVKQAKARKLSNDIVVNRWGLKIIEKVINQSLKQEKLLELYKKLSNLYEKLYSMELSELSLNSNYYEIEIIKLKHQIKEIENENSK